MSDPPRLCECPKECHRHHRAQHKNYMQLDQVGFHVYATAQLAQCESNIVGTDDIVEAALACDACRDRHTPAILSREPWRVIRREHPPTIADATACTEDPDDGN